MRKKVLCILRCVTLGVLLGALIDFLAFTVIPLREAIYGWLGYYMTYFPAIAILVGGLAGLVAAFRILSMKRYATITGILLVILVVSSAVYFINATGDDFEEKTGGLHQIKHIGIPANSPSEAAVQLDLIHHSRQNRLPKVRILPDNKVYKGEDLVNDTTLGRYIVELFFTDTRIQEKPAKKLFANNYKITSNPDNILQVIKPAYPPDDSQMIIYLGCTAKPQVIIQEENNKLLVRLRR